MQVLEHLAELETINSVKGRRIYKHILV